MNKEPTENMKFKVKNDLTLYEALQQDGRPSEEEIARRTNIPATSVHRAKKRITERDFFRIQAVPLLEKFGEIPMAIIGFSNIHPLRIRELLKRYTKKAETVQFFHSEKDVMMMVMEKSMKALIQRLFDIMEQVEEKPSLYMTSPIVARFAATIPARVLEGVYSDLLDRKAKE